MHYIIHKFVYYFSFHYLFKKSRNLLFNEKVDERSDFSFSSSSPLHFKEHDKNDGLVSVEGVEREEEENEDGEDDEGEEEEEGEDEGCLEVTLTVVYRRSKPSEMLK
jgi:hypothetical protein